MARQTRNPDKYNKNTERNRLRSIQLERQSIQSQAVKQAEQLAAEHDPTGKMFNVGPVTMQKDGTVVSVEVLQRREEARARRAAEAAAKEEAAKEEPQPTTNSETPDTDRLNPQRFLQMELQKKERPRGLSKNQQRKLEALKPRPPPPKPIIPEHISLPPNEENFIALWDLSDTELERRVLREKRRKAAERKALRLKQKSGKAERRMARDEKRAVYRDIKLTWKTIKEETSREKARLKACEEEESRKIAIEVNEAERARAMELCHSLGFTLENTEGVSDIKPKALGMKGMEVDFDSIEPDKEKQGNIRFKDPEKALKQQEKPKNPKRVDLGGISGNARSVIPSQRRRAPKDDDPEGEEGAEFIKLDLGPSESHFQPLSYNHRLRRKLRRALDNCQIARETLVRERAIAHYQSLDQAVPDILKTPYKPVNTKGVRILENGMLETKKQERVKQRMDLEEFNRNMKVLRRQAKQTAIEAGLRKHAEVTGRIPVVRKEGEGDDKEEKDKRQLEYLREVRFNNGPARFPGDDYGLGGDGNVDVEMVDAEPGGKESEGGNSDDDSEDSNGDSDSE